MPTDPMMGPLTESRMLAEAEPDALFTLGFLDAANLEAALQYQASAWLETAATRAAQGCYVDARTHAARAVVLLDAAARAAGRQAYLIGVLGHRQAIAA